MSTIFGHIWRSSTGKFGLILAVAIIGSAVFAPWLTGDPNRIDVLNRFAGPSWQHWMGTDHLGRDLFSRILHGARIAMEVAAAVTAIALSLGTVLGVAAGYGPRQVERPILILFDILYSFPNLIFALALVAILGPGLENVVIIVAMTVMPHFGRIARAQVLRLKHAPFLEAERVLGASTARIVFRHVIPNIAGPLIVVAGMEVPAVITIEAGLSFLGLGARPPLASWGTLLHDGYTYLSQSAWPVFFAGMMLTTATLAFTLFGEALRDAIDPRLRTDP